MELIKKFNHEQFGEIRTLTNEKGETFFIGKDVATALGYAKPENAIATHVETDDKTTTLIQGTGSNYKSKVVVINESGLYALILSSKLAQAKAFKRWVTNEVLPQIRRTGGYIPIRNTRTGEVLTADEVLARANRILQRTIECKNLPADGCITTTDIAKTLDMETKDLNSFLTDVGVLKWKRGQFRLTPTYEGQGLAMDRLFIYYSKDGKEKRRNCLVWTPKGVEWIKKWINRKF